MTRAAGKAHRGQPETPEQARQGGPSAREEAIRAREGDAGLRARREAAQRGEAPEQGDGGAK